MDHLTLPKESTLKLPDIPLIFHGLAPHPHLLKYDGPFEEYPKYHGFEDVLRALHNDDITRLSHSCQTTGAFLQQWLFFYFLKKTVGTSLYLHWEDFSRRNSSGHLLVSTEKLNNYLKLWAETLHGQEPGGPVFDCFRQASFWTTRLVDLISCGDFELLPQEVLLSIYVLGSSVYQAYRTATHTRSHSTFRMYVSTARNSHVVIPPLLRTWLLEAGFCEYDIAKLAQTQDVSTIFYLCGSFNKASLGSANHSNCSEARCYVMQIDESGYNTRHTTQLCGCEHISANISDVKEILKNGGIPIVNLKPGERIEVNDSDKRDDRSSTLRTPYVAISHVWADGLGNTRENSLPICQLQRLRHLLRKFEPVVKNRLKEQLSSRLADDTSPNPADDTVSSQLWIDTLCIPRPTTTCTSVEREEMESCRQQAISRMNDTYACAGAVLALDSDLMSIPYDRPLQELMPRTLVCGWMKRLWTYLEAGLATKKLYIQFLGGALHVWQGFTCLREEVERGDPLGYDITYRVLEQFKDLYWFFVGFVMKDQLIQQLRPVILQRYLHDSRARTTTRPGDRYICLAIVLGFPREAIRQISRSSGSDKTRALIQYFTQLPRSIVYSPGAKLLVDGYRWACQPFWDTIVDQDLVDHQDNETSYNAGGGSAILRPDGGGLLVKSVGVLMEHGNWLVDSTRLSRPWICKLSEFWTTEARTYKIMADGQAITAQDSMARAFADKTWWRRRAFVALVPDLLYKHATWAPIPGALLVMSEKVPWETIARIDTAGDDSSDDEFFYFTKDGEGDRERSTVAHECRYICAITLQRIRDDDPLLAHPACQDTFPFERHWRIL